jgi:AraC-like DNA-binding protein
MRLSRRHDHYHRIVDAKLFIDAHYTHNIEIQTIASQAAFSKYHFLRLFKHSYNLTPHQYLLSLRIERAKEMLSQNTSVTETCYALGFESVSSFNRLFKSRVFISPSRYAQRMKTRNHHITSQPLHLVPMCFIDYMGWGK